MSIQCISCCKLYKWLGKMSYGRFFACGNKLLSPTMEPDLTIVMTLVKTRFLKKKIICHGIEWLGLANFSGKFLGNLFDDNEHHTNFCRFYPLNPSFRSGQSDRMKKKPSSEHELQIYRIFSITDSFSDMMDPAAWQHVCGRCF